MNTDVSFYLGKSRRGEYTPFIPNHYFVIGTCGSGKTSFVNNFIIKSMIEFVNDLHFELHCFVKDDFGAWCDDMPCSYYVPGIEVNNYYTDENETACYGDSICTIDSFEDTMKRILEEARAMNKMCKENNIFEFSNLRKNGITTKPYKVIIIDEYEAYVSKSKENADFFQAFVNEITASSVFSGIYLMLVSQGMPNNILEPLMGRFVNIITSADEETCLTLMNTREPSEDENKFGYAWIGVKRGLPYKVRVAFYSNDWIRKFVTGFMEPREEEDIL